MVKRIQVLDRGYSGQKYREEAGNKDDHNSRDISDADPEDDKWHPGNRSNRTQNLKNRIYIGEYSWKASE